MKTVKFSAILMMALLAFASCKKEGCTDGNATNFDEDAKKDDGTCTYEGQAVLWYGQETSEAMVSDWISSLTFYVDGKVVGSSASNVYFTGAPDCGAEASVTVTKDLGLTKGKSYEYSVIDDWGDMIWSGILNFEANTCMKLELTY